jgi:hypothetical protein
VVTTELHNNKGTILVDDQDSHWLDLPWYEHKGTNTSYARTKITRDGWHKFVFLHRAILQPTDDQVVDHINGNGLDNRRANLRLCTKAQNTCNRPGYGKTSRFKGVSWSKRHRAWVMQIRDGDRRICQYFGKGREEDAAMAYDEHARRIFGEFAHLNFPQRAICLAALLAVA